MYKLEARLLAIPATDQDPGMKVKPLFPIVNFLHLESSLEISCFTVFTKSNDCFI